MDFLAWLVRKHPVALGWVGFVGVVLAFGFIPVLHPGFVRMDTFQGHTTEEAQKFTALNSHEALTDAGQIAELKEKECELPKAENSDKDAYRKTILTLRAECISDGGGSLCDIPGCGAL